MKRRILLGALIGASALAAVPTAANAATTCTFDSAKRKLEVRYGAGDTRVTVRNGAGLEFRAGTTGAFQNCFSATGVMRQMLAIVTQPNRTAALRSLRIPALVIHGLADKMVHVSGGRATASAVPGTELLLIEGMGHDMPAQLFDTFVEGIRRTADRAGTPTT